MMRLFTISTAAMIAFSLVAALSLLAGTETFRTNEGSRVLGVEQIVENVRSLAGATESQALATTAEWRLQWWSRIVDYTLAGPYLRDGKGFGVNLATEDGFRVDAEQTLRSPHNVSMALLARGGIILGPSLEYLERGYDDWKRGTWSQKPFLDIVLPSVLDPTMAPPGKHYMSVFVQFVPPTLADGPWTDEKRDAFGETVLGTIESVCPGFRKLILDCWVRTPADLEADVGLTEGNIFQGELTLDQLLFNRPLPGYAQYRGPVKGFYMCGSSTHPGGGVMGAPGANAAREILLDLKRRAA